MKRAIAVSIGIVLFSTPLFAQGGTIALFANQDGIDCNLYESEPGLLRIFVFHLFYEPGVRASQFAVPTPGCAVGLIWIGDTCPFPTAVTSGYSPTGIAVPYDGCWDTPLHILTINYWSEAIANECCVFATEPDPRVLSGEIIMVDCDFNTRGATGAHAVLNPTIDCRCASVPVERSTWGSVKALYVE